jgi:hypothetical protein
MQSPALAFRSACSHPMPRRAGVISLGFVDSAGQQYGTDADTAARYGSPVAALEKAKRGRRLIGGLRS